MLLDEAQHFLIARDDGLRQVLQRSENDAALAQSPECKLACDEGMHQNLCRLEQPDEVLIRPTEMIDPNRTVGQDQTGLCLRRGGAARSASLPPSRAKRRALSRSMRALSASRTRTDFSFNPVKAWAFRKRSSSRARVVRIGTSLSSFDARSNAFKAPSP